MKRTPMTAMRNSLLISIALFTFAGLCFGQAEIMLSEKCGPPSASISISGNGFSAETAIDIYFDGTLEASTVTNSTGSFSNVKIQVPSSALPGEHAISGVETSGGTKAQSSFKVDTTWLQFGFTAKAARLNPFENVLNISTVINLGIQWTFQTGGSVDGSPAVVNGVVYIGSNNGFYALSAATGEKLWVVNVGPNYVVDSSPAVANGIVYIGLNGTVTHVAALNANTGTQLWSFAIGGYVEGPIVVTDGVVYFGSLDNKVYALNAATGAKLWSFTTGGYVTTPPAVANSVVYVESDDNHLYALNAVTGAKLWSVGIPLYSYGGPAVANHLVYFGSGDTDGPSEMYALNAATGSVVWSYTIASEFCSSPAVANGLVYVGSLDKNLYALNTVTGALVWNYTTGDVVCASPALANDVVYIGSGDNNVYALNAATGTLLWSYATENEIISSPAVANGVLYIGSEDGNVYAFAGQAQNPTPDVLH